MRSLGRKPVFLVLTKADPSSTFGSYPSFYCQPAAPVEAFPALNLPAYATAIREDKGKAMIFDPIRRKYVRLTPEEWVRQHFVQYLVRDLGTPAALVAIEAGFTYQQMARRADIIVYDRRGKPLLMVECKAPAVPISQAVFDQVARYNKVVGARYLVVTNGQEHYACALDHEQHTYHFLDAIPHYEAL